MITLTDWDAVKDEIVEEEKEEDVKHGSEGDEEEVIEEADEGEMLVLRRVLSSQKSEKGGRERTFFTLDILFRGKYVR